MKLIEINWHPTHRQLRQFGVICLVALPVLGWIWGGNFVTITILALVGFLLTLGGFVLPSVLKPVFVALTVVTIPIGLVIGELTMLMIYFGVFLPFGLVFRLVKRDCLQLKIDRNEVSYWKKKKQPTNVASYYRQS